ncbi:MAG: competence protein ComEA [Actinomycetota bacterium]|nr:competence protein ComEA [Actinomycetota bacterium]
MSGSSPEPREAPVSPPHLDPHRPNLVAPLAERWAVWRREPRVAATALAVVALAGGAWWVRLSVSEPSGAVPKTASHSATTSSAAYSQPTVPVVPTTTSGIFVVDVVGAVRQPGVVSLPGTARVVDAVTAAGGALPNADLDRINLAAHLVDGMRIAVPRRGVASDPAGPSADPGGAAAAGGAATGEAPTPAAPLDLNTATQAQLEELPGIGPTLAQAIIQEREREGGFHSVDDLRRVSGIGDARFARLRPLVTL